VFHYYLKIINVLQYGDRGKPLDRFTGQRRSVKRYRTIGCLVIVKPPNKRNGKLEVNFRRGFFLGCTGDLLQILYWDLVSMCAKRAYTVIYKKIHTVMDRPSPNSRKLCDALDGKDLQAETNEYGAPAAVDLVSSSCPFIKLKVLELQIHCAELDHAYTPSMAPHSTGAALSGWRRNYDGAYSVELDSLPVLNSDEFSQACATVCAFIHMHPKATVTLNVSPKRKEPMRGHINQFLPMIRTLFKIQEGMPITTDDMLDDDKIIHAIRSVKVSYDIDIKPGQEPDLDNYPAVEFEEGTLPSSSWTRR
jgi:hypothetical protein